MTLQICDIEKSEELSKEKMAETTGGHGYRSYDYRHDGYEHCYGGGGYEQYSGRGYGQYGGYFKGYPSHERGYGKYGDFNQQFNGGINIGNGVDNTNFV
jgi:hypothetical protein